ncbi:phenylacetate--CoA ligase family protein [Paenibacillus chitinolyticus]|uniref:phenylacetate--CoA ligase family protein n=1 Tax=Paenibacillus chitinolyticus TaxID=79263 RepID=UPI00355852CA
MAVTARSQIELMSGQKAADRFEPHVRWLNSLTERGMSVENLSQAEVDAYHRRALRSLLQFVYETNEYYKQRIDITGLTPEEASNPALFAQLPFLTKEDLRNDPRCIICSPDLAHIHTSTGTTGGKPIFIGHTLNDLYRLDTAPRYPSLMQNTRNTVVGNALPYEMSSSGLSFHRVFQYMQDCCVLPVGKGGAYSQPDKALECMLAWDMQTLVIAPSYAVTLAEHAQKLGMDLHRDFNLQHLFLTGEGASPALRERIERIWSTPVTTWYGSLEVGLIGIECLEHQGYHLAEGHNYTEIVHPVTGEPQAPGIVGEVVLTTLMRDGMPIIRYKTGDLGCIDDGPCPCGCRLRRLQLRGRMGDQLALNSGNFSPLYLEQQLLQIGGTGNWYQFIVENGELSILVEASDSSVDRAELLTEIKLRIEASIQQSCDVQVVDYVERDAGKARRVIRL